MGWGETINLKSLSKITRFWARGNVINRYCLDRWFAVTNKPWKRPVLRIKSPSHLQLCLTLALWAVQDPVFVRHDPRCYTFKSCKSQSEASLHEQRRLFFFYGARETIIIWKLIVLCHSTSRQMEEEMKWEMVNNGNQNAVIVHHVEIRHQHEGSVLADESK